MLVKSKKRTSLSRNVLSQTLDFTGFLYRALEDSNPRPFGP